MATKIAINGFGRIGRPALKRKGVFPAPGGRVPGVVPEVFGLEIHPGRRTAQ